MLILSRKSGESITIGEDITITILDSKGKNIRIGVEAPRNIAVHRKDIDEYAPNAAQDMAAGSPGKEANTPETGS